ncbi:putative lipid II flippase FtsW [Brevibacterium renqingii]|uniref:putative lipid II flippase FtsW n=1 Tax=Brevibacterium renqingii TaxID=2776916 RepID=UPI001ADFF14B|nr:putative lipid II flippase FtsW [Brevibacterium renqingii]
MGRQTTAKADARRRRKTAKKSKATSAPGATKTAGAKTAASRGSAAATTTATKPATATATKTTTATKPGAKKPAVKKPAASRPTAAKERGARNASVLRHAWTTLREDFARVSAYPLTTYYLILVSVLALTGLGLVMVLSASSITSYDGGEGSSFAYFNKQAMFAGVGIALMFAASLMPLVVWRSIAWWAMLGGIVLQACVFVPGFGKSTKGNANWIGFGGFQIQPSEFLKVALALWLGLILAQKFGKMTTFGHAMIPVVPGVLVAVGLVVGGNDLGTGLVLMAMAVVCLFIGGFPTKYFFLLGSILTAAVVFFVLSSENRLKRIQAMLTGHADQSAADTMGQAWQSNHGLFSLASGGWLGVGLGASREKWSWLPEAHNDFIFAIIGEELGLIGSLIVVFVFGVLGYGMIRVVMRSQNLMVQVATAGYFALLIGQAAINIGVVTGLLPVIGLPLPFVSYGGSSIIASLLAVGVLLSFARSEPGAEAAIAVHRDRLRSSFAVLARKRRK